MLGHVRQSEGLVPFGAAMVIITLDRRRRFSEADVVEARKAGTVYIFDCVIGHQKVLFPPKMYNKYIQILHYQIKEMHMHSPHENVVSITKGIIVKCVSIKVLGIGMK